MKCLGLLATSALLHDQVVLLIGQLLKWHQMAVCIDDVLYVLPTNNLEESESIDVEDGAELKQIRAAFKKLYKGKNSNKKMLSSLSKTIA